MSKRHRLYGSRIDGMLDDFEMRYSVAAYVLSALLSAVLLPLSIYVGFMRGANPGSHMWFSVFIVLGTPFFIVLTAVAILGFAKLALTRSNKLLGYSVVLLILHELIGEGLTAFAEILRLMGSQAAESVEMFTYLFIAVPGGVLGILFGVGVYRLGKDRLFKVAGALNVLVGLLFASIVLTIFGIGLNVFVMALEAYLLHVQGRKK